MPCHHYFDGETLRFDFVDTVTNQDFTDLAAKVEELERRCAVVPHRISDLSQTTGLNFGFPVLFTFTERRKTLRFRNAFKSAIVATQTVHVGLARMFQTLNQHPQITIEIFPDLASAQAWIARDLL